jgi:type I restriction enzyme S subunit
MRAKAYPKYKNSQVEWLGKVPEHWNSASLKWISVRYSGGTPDKTISEYWEDGTIPWLNSGAVNDGYILEPSTYITEEAFKNSSAKWIPKNALVMALAGQGKTKGMVAHLGFKTTCNQSMAAIIPDKKVHSRFLYWWLTKNYFNLRNLAGGEARDGLNLDLIGAVPCPLLPFHEQESIAFFLDRETRQIDTLIDKKQCMIELLKEKRTALISRAVTKGLNPKAKLKPSGVEWLKEVPEHWEVNRVKHIANTISKGTTPSTEGLEILEEGKIRFLKAENLVDNSLCPEPEFFIDEKTNSFLSRSILKEKDILIVIAGATIGKVAILEDAFLPANTNQAVCFIRLQLPEQSRFVWYYFRSDFVRHQILVNSVQSAQPNISMSLIKELVLPSPPLSEQQAISTFLDRETAKIDKLVSKVEEAILKLKEYRTAIISAAVTGKIDVREAA